MKKLRCSLKSGNSRIAVQQGAAAQVQVATVPVAAAVAGAGAQGPAAAAVDVAGQLQVHVSLIGMYQPPFNRK
jgi:hypothetical protein